jgi:hypothetical protein
VYNFPYGKVKKPIDDISKKGLRGKDRKEMSDLNKYLDEQLKNPEFAAEWASQRPKRKYVKAIIAARVEQNLMQEELSRKAVRHRVKTCKMGVTNDIIYDIICNDRRIMSGNQGNEVRGKVSVEMPTFRRIESFLSMFQEMIILQ